MLRLINVLLSPPPRNQKIKDGREQLPLLLFIITDLCLRLWHLSLFRWVLFDSSCDEQLCHLISFTLCIFYTSVCNVEIATGNHKKKREHKRNENFVITTKSFIYSFLPLCHPSHDAIQINFPPSLELVAGQLPIRIAPLASQRLYQGVRLMNF